MAEQNSLNNNSYVFSVDTDITIGGNIYLPSTTSTVGQIQFINIPVLHVYDGTTPSSPTNIWIGANSGNFTTTGQNNVAVGEMALFHNAAGELNVAIGQSALATNTDGGGNVAIGQAAMNANTTGFNCIGIGNLALYHHTSGQYNTAIGYVTGGDIQDGQFNSAFGAGALQGCISGSNNIAVGQNSGQHIVNGGNNIHIGNTDNAIDESGVIRIGENSLQIETFIQGIYGVTPGLPSPQFVVIDSNGQLGSTASGGGGGGGALEFIQVQTASSVAEVDFTTGITPSNDNYLLKIWDVSYDTVLSNGLVIQISTDGGSTYISTGYVTSGASTTVGMLAGQFPLNDSLSQTSADIQLYSLTSGAGEYPSSVCNYVTNEPTFPDLSQAGQGSYYNATATVVNALRLVMSDGTTFSGSFALYSYAVTGGGGGSGISTLDGDSGSATGSTVTIAGDGTNITTIATSSTVTVALNPSISVSGIDVTGGVIASSLLGATNLVFSDVNNNVTVGPFSGSGITGATNNTLLGYNAGATIANAPDNVCIGHNSDVDAGGSSNIAIGSSCSVYGGSNNVFIGAGLNSATCSNGIAIGVGSSPGATADSIGIGGAALTNGDIVIGSAGTHLAAYVCGIYGVTTGSITTSAVIVDNNNQLGTILSSLRFKENIQEMADSDRIYDLNPVNFSYINDTHRTKQWGLIAEEVQEVFPELVNHDEQGPHSVKYHELPVILLKEIQRLNRRIEALEAKE